jgi:hypothetical protein
MHGKVLIGQGKTRLSSTEFTLCLPGSPKVNAGGACGAWLPGREQLRISASTIATREQGGLFCLEAATQPELTETSHVPELAKLLAGTTIDELVQWMVQDASPDRCDR